MLTLAGVALAGALAVSIVVTKYGSSDTSPAQIASRVPLPPPQVATQNRVPAVVQPLVAPSVPATTANKKTASASLPVETGSSVIPATQDADGQSSQRPAMTAVTRSPNRSARRLVMRSATTASEPDDSWPEHLVVIPAASAPVSQARDSCDRLERRDLAWCLRPQLLNADRQLRDAYHQASQAGVDGRVLSSYRRQWSKFRRQANSDPRRVAAGFRDMAQQLDAERTGAGGM